MLNKIKDWSENGIKFFMAWDSSTDKPSATLFFSYVAFILSVISVIVLHFRPDLFVGSATTITLWVIATVLYMFRRLQKAKFDLDDRSFELEGEEENEDKNNVK